MLHALNDKSTRYYNLVYTEWLLTVKPSSLSMNITVNYSREELHLWFRPIITPDKRKTQQLYCVWVTMGNIFYLLKE